MGKGNENQNEEKVDDVSKPSFNFCWQKAKLSGRESCSNVCSFGGFSSKRGESILSSPFSKPTRWDDDNVAKVVENRASTTLFSTEQIRFAIDPLHCIAGVDIAGVEQEGEKKKEGRAKFIYRVARVDVRVVLQMLEDLVEVTVACSSQEARLGVRLYSRKQSKD